MVDGMKYWSSLAGLVCGQCYSILFQVVDNIVEKRPDEKLHSVFSFRDVSK
tara:strand:- start:572 stop:724 length:153 start_codon:yes stop_codon:yes gene_type:complete